MKKIYLLLLFFIYSVLIHAQENFEKGYYISNENDTVDCFINTSKFKFNPNNFEFKKDKKSQIETGTIKEVKEFGIINELKFIRSKVLIDYSGKTISELKNHPSPYWKNEEVFLKVLIEGNANLYEFSNEQFTRFFYSINNIPITQLENYCFLVDSTTVKVNPKYKNQLKQDIHLDKISIEYINDVFYSQKELINYFKKYNTKFSEPYKEYKLAKEILTTLQLGINRSYVNVSNFDGTKDIAKFPIKYNLQLGTELSSNFDGKFNFFIRPTFQIYQNEVIYKWIDFKIALATINFPIGVNYKIYQNNDLSLNLGLSYAFLYLEAGGIALGKSGESFNSLNNLIVDLGLNYKKYSVFYSYSTPRYLTLNSFNEIDAYYYYNAVTLGYTFGK